MRIKIKYFYYAFLVLFGLVALGLIAVTFLKPITQDEGVFLTISNRILRGEYPYLNYFDHKPPGIYLAGLVAGSFGFIFSKILLWIINLGTAFFVYLVGEEKRRGSGIISALFFIASLVFFEGNYFLAEPFMAFFIAFAFFLTNRKKFLLAGIFAGFALLFKQTALPSTFILTIYAFYKTDSKERWQYFFGLILFPLFCLAWILINGLQKEAFRQIITLNFTAYPPESLASVLRSLWPVFIKTWWFWIFAIYGILRSKKEFIMLFLVLVPIPFFFVRGYPHYWIQVLPFAAVFAGMGFYAMFQRFPKLQLLIMLLVLVSLWQNFLWFYWIEKNIDLPKLKEQKQVTDYLKSKPQKRILTENQFTGYYFLSKKEPLTKYLYLTEINRGEGAEDKTIGSLNESTIIIWPLDSSFSYAKKLQCFIISNYQKSREYPALGLAIWESNGQ